MLYSTFYLEMFFPKKWYSPNNDVFIFLDVGFTLTNGTDPDGITHAAAFQINP